MTKGLELLKQAADCRDLAKQARRLVRAFRDDQDRKCLLQYAEELEGQAVDLEKQAASSDWDTTGGSSGES